MKQSVIAIFSGSRLRKLRPLDCPYPVAGKQMLLLCYRSPLLVSPSTPELEPRRGGVAWVRSRGSWVRSNWSSAVPPATVL